jgi:hypothetical protein
MESSLHRFSKWQLFSKRMKNWFFDHNSVSFEHFRVLFFDLSLYFSPNIFHWSKVLSDFRWRLMSKMAAEIQSSITLVFSIFLRSVFINEFVFSPATWIKSIHCQFSQTWHFDPKWRIKINFFGITLRVSNIFSIFFLNSFDVTDKTQIL